MRFLVGRTSQGAVSKDPPCPGAVRGREAPAWPGEYEWYLELAGLDDLVRLLNESGGLALWAPEEGDAHPAIEILDEECGEECGHDHGE